MMDALEGNPLAAPAEGRRDAHAAQDRGQGTTAAGGGQGSAPDDAPLPNPWGPAGGEAAGGDGPGGQGMLGSNPFAALLGGGAPGGLPDLGNASGETTDRDAFLREFSNGMMMDHDARQVGGSADAGADVGAGEAGEAAFSLACRRCSRRWYRTQR